MSGANPVIIKPMGCKLGSLGSCELMQARSRGESHQERTPSNDAVRCSNLRLHARPPGGIIITLMVEAREHGGMTPCAILALIGGGRGYRGGPSACAIIAYTT